MGGKKNPIWRVVVADGRSPRDGRIIETVGRYNAQTDPSEIVLDTERIRHWLERGAQPSSTVLKLMRTQGMGPGGEEVAAALPKAAKAPKAAAAQPPAPKAEADSPAADATAPAAEAEAAPSEPPPEEPAPETEPAPSEGDDPPADENPSPS